MCLPLMTQKGQDEIGNLQSSAAKVQGKKTEVDMLRSLVEKLIGGHNDRYECGASGILRVCIWYAYIEE